MDVVRCMIDESRGKSRGICISYHCLLLCCDSEYRLIELCCDSDIVFMMIILGRSIATTFDKNFPFAIFSSLKYECFVKNVKLH